MCEYCTALLSSFRNEVHKNGEHVIALITTNDNLDDISLRSYQHPDVDDTTLKIVLEELLENLKTGTVFTRPMKYKHNPN